MSYKVEITGEVYEASLRRTLAAWSKQEPDVQLVSREGHSIFSHRVLLSFYSSQLQRILGDPVIMFSPQPASISVPASASALSALLRMLTCGKVETADTQDEVRAAAEALGININNCEREDGMNSASLLPSSLVTVRTIKLPNKNITKKIKSISTPISESHSNEGKAFCKQEIRKGKISASRHKTSPSSRSDAVQEHNDSESATCGECGKTLLNRRQLNRHRLRLHGLRIRGEGGSLQGDTTCNVCGETFAIRRHMTRHRVRKHGLKLRNRKNIKAASDLVIKEEVNEEETNSATLQESDEVDLNGGEEDLSEYMSMEMME